MSKMNQNNKTESIYTERGIDGRDIILETRIRLYATVHVRLFCNC
jgi:hypothetical protein